MQISLFTLATLLLVSSSTAFMSPPSRSSNIARGGASDTNDKTPTALHMAQVNDPVAFAKNEIATNDIMIFSKSYCPYCDATKATFAKMDGVKPKIIELDVVENGPAIQAALQEMTGQRTVPNVFVKGTHIGGNDDTQLAVKMGKIKKMLGQ
jgi:glutaredoxin 3